MKKLIAIGEALIDFIPEESGKGIKDVSGFLPAVGGAPANVCGAFSKLGGESAMITQLGDDPFGDKIMECLEENHIDTAYVSRTKMANTSLAFVALKEDGNREFSFYRKPGADMLLTRSQIKKEWFADAYAFHFCSVSIGDFPMKDAHKQAISYAKEAGTMISFDPNLRFALWDSEEALKKAVLEFLPMANILKISDEEVEFITGKASMEEAKDELLTGNVEMIVYTRGKDGACVYTKTTTAEVPGKVVQAVDTTGAGDGFIGSFLYCLYKDGVTLNTIKDLTEDKLKEYLTFANKFCSISVQRKGAIASYPSYEEVENLDENVAVQPTEQTQKAPANSTGKKHTKRHGHKKHH